MSAPHPMLEGLVASAMTATAGIVAIAQDIPISGKEVGIGTALVGGGFWLAKFAEKWLSRMTESIDKTTEAIRLNSVQQAEVAKSMALLMHESNEARRDGDEKRRQILAALADLPDRVADELKRTRTA